VAFGDCAITGNVTAMRNPLGSAEPVLRRAYLDPSNLRPQIPKELGVVPPLLENVLPLHEVVPVDHYLPGCPPPAARIKVFLQELVAGKAPQLAGRNISFG
jgi:NAD-reducing hydrogenase small subunit